MSDGGSLPACEHAQRGELSPAGLSLCAARAGRGPCISRNCRADVCVPALLLPARLPGAVCVCSYRGATGEGNFELDASQTSFLQLKVWVPRLREY